MLTQPKTPKLIEKKSTYSPIEIGRVLTVESSSVRISINKLIIRNNQLQKAQIGTILKIITSDSVVVTMVSSLAIGTADDEGLKDGCIATLSILGEITTNATTRETKFFRGVKSFPVLNEAVYNMSPTELELIFNREKSTCIEIGRLQQDNSIVAKVRTDDLLSKHFAIIGSTGSGKSCTVALVLQAILAQSPHGHIVLFDPHNEYSKSFGERAEVIDNASLDLPLWVFDFEETVELLASDNIEHAAEEREILHDLILKAKRLYDRSLKSNEISSQLKLDSVDAELQRATHISLDSPVPYRVRDLLKLVEYHMGKLENNSNLAPYKRLKNRINTMIVDPRYQFILRNQTAPRPIEEVIGRIFRIPVNNKPISILDFSSVPEEALNIVVSVVSRLAFEIATWSERQIPILLVCEEAHRYIPRDKSLGFHSTRRMIGRIAKEGRKYGVSLAIVSQRPSELEPSTLSQCSTIFSMRLSNEIDQNFVKAAVPDGAADLLSFLPSLGTAETMVFGEAVNLPMRVNLNNLPAQYRPHSSSADFTDLWQRDTTSPEFMGQVFDRWRNRSLGEKGLSSQQAPSQTQPAMSAHVQGHAQTHHGHGAHINTRQHNTPQQGMPRYNPAPSQPSHGQNTPSGAVRQRLMERAMNKPASLGDVKSALSAAFNRDM